MSLLWINGTLIDKADAEAATVVVAYTHGQPAQPTTFGHYLAAYIEVLTGDIERLAAARMIVVDASDSDGASFATRWNMAVTTWQTRGRVSTSA